MKFITEQNIRMQYKNSPFSEFVLKSGNRLTASAKDFLTQRQIKIIKEEQLKSIKEAEKNKEDLIRPVSDVPKEKAILTLKRINAYVLQSSLEYIKRDFKIYEDLISIYNYVQDVIDGKFYDFPSLAACTGLGKQDLKNINDSCFEITSIHISCEKSYEIINLNYIRSMFQEVVHDYSIDVQKSLNQVINKLSRMICLAYGGKECQRKTHI